MKNLSRREVEIINHTACGYTAKEIARFTGLTHKTIETYMINLRKKMGAKNSAHAIYLAFRMNVLQLS
jgi:DNA-binding NarL/FixJ family response regulator